MRGLKVVLIIGLAYVGMVVLFESLIGVIQPAGDGTLMIATRDGDGRSSGRIVSRLESGGTLYVAANHWPRAWYEQALADPQVEVALDGPAKPYQAVPVSGAEHDRVAEEHPLPLPFRILTGFPPRTFLRLDPR
jgi:hypothetical protein